MKMKLYLAMALLSMIIVLGGCTGTITGQSVQKTDTIKIGVVAPLTGHLAFFGEWMSEGFEIALEEIETEGGINGKKIELLYEDTLCEPKPTIDGLNKLNEVDAVTAFLGPFCGSSVKVAASFASDKQKLIMSPGNNFGKLSDYMFHTEHLISKEAQFLADSAYEQLGLRKIGILYYDNDWGTANKESFAERFEELGGKITVIEGFTSATKDFRTQLAKIKSKDSDGLFIAYSNPGFIIKQAGELGLEVQIIGERGIQNPDLIEIADDYAEGVVFSYPGLPKESSETQRRFEQIYEEKYNKTPHLVAANSYDALKLLAQALRKCDAENFSSECMKEYLQDLESFDGASGVIDFKEGIWNMDRGFHLRTIDKGKFAVLS